MKQFFTVILVLVALLFGLETKASCWHLLTIDSLPQLKKYEFIAHVKILDEQDYKNPSIEDNTGTMGLLTIKIIELFKGDSITQVVEYDRNSTTSIGVSKGEEWILFGRNINGMITIIGCDRNKRYKTNTELRDWKYGKGFRELRKLRELYQHSETDYVNEIRQEFYSNGQKEIEETYISGMLNGERKIWYPNGVLFCKQYYINDTLDGKAEWFYPTGQIYDEDYYLKGKPCNVSRRYHDSTAIRYYMKFAIDDSDKTKNTLDFATNRIQPQYETVFDSYGRVIISKEYTHFGKIRREETIDPNRKFRIVIYYHDNGLISSIMYSVNGKNYGHYQTYDKNGFPSIGWDYDENGEKIK